MSESHEMVVIIRPSFKKFCGDDACQAAVFNHLLYWIARKAKGQSEKKIVKGEISWYGTAEEICEGMAQSWSVNKVRKEIKALVEAHLMGQRRNPANRWDQTRHYFIGEEEGKALNDVCEKYDICLRHLGLNPDVIHLLNLVNAIDKNGKRSCQKCEMELQNMADGSTKSGNTIPKETTKTSTKDSNKEDSSPTIRLVKSKPDQFIDLLIEEVSERFNALDCLEGSQEKAKELYQQARRTDEKRFREASQETLQAMEGMTHEEAQRYERENLIDYYFWHLCHILGISASTAEEKKSVAR